MTSFYRILEIARREGDPPNDLERADCVAFQKRAGFLRRDESSPPDRGNGWPWRRLLAAAALAVAVVVALVWFLASPWPDGKVGDREEALPMADPPKPDESREVVNFTKGPDIKALTDWKAVWDDRYDDQLPAAVNLRSLDGGAPPHIRRVIADLRALGRSDAEILAAIRPR